eukprot:Clim_evm4s44 gene=Clim_evmTU4s44
MYEDREFDANDRSLGPVENVKNVAWLRPKEMVSNPELFKDGVEPGDICQGQLGDCWFLGGLAVMAGRRDLIGRCINTGEHDEGQGKYVFNFYKFGQWHKITIDDRVPCVQEGPVFASGKDPEETWVMLVEKAYAKLHGTYNHLVGGWVDDALVDMTGGFPDTIFMDDDEWKRKAKDGSLWEVLKSHQASSEYLMGCARSTTGKREEDTGRGILQGHAYSILDVKEACGKKMIKCRNPWGAVEWSGPLSDKDSFWTPERLAEAGHTTEEDGTFIIAYEDFIEEFNKVYMCRLIGEQDYKRVAYKCKWSHSDGTAGGCANNQSWVDNPQYQLQVFDDSSEILLSLQQPDPRMAADGNGNREPIGFSVLDAEADNQKTSEYRELHRSDITPMREETTVVRLDRGIYNIVPFTFDAGKDQDFVFTAASKSDFVLKSLDGHSPMTGNTEPPAGKEPPAVDPNRKKAPPVSPSMGTKERPQDDPGIVGKIVKAVITKLGTRYPQLKSLPVDSIAGYADKAFNQYMQGQKTSSGPAPGGTSSGGADDNVGGLSDAQVKQMKGCLPKGCHIM